VSEDQSQKKFDPTPKRVEEFRKRGQIALSRDLATIGALIGGSAGGLATAVTSQSFLAEELAVGFALTDEPLEAITRATVCFVRLFAPTALGALTGWLAAASVQLGAPPALAPFKLDLTRIASPSTLLEIFSPKKQAERALKALAKLVVVAMAASAALSAEWSLFQASPAIDADTISDRALAAIGRVTSWSGGALLLLAFLDLGLAKRRIGQEMKMTLEEMRKELKESDGDPHIKRRRKQRMRELSKKRFTAAVKSSDVVLVNPTEYAVALRYKSKKDPAPRVVAKGKDKVAERIRALAREHGVPIVVNIPLARLLHKVVPEGKVIPAHTFRAVAEVLGYVYRLRGRRTR
jgi:flagellar biosynthesis protein FlhB